LRLSDFQRYVQLVSRITGDFIFSEKKKTQVSGVILSAGRQGITGMTDREFKPAS